MSTGFSRSREILALFSPFDEATPRSHPLILDWEEVWRFSAFHGVRPALSAALDRSPPDSQPSWLKQNLIQFNKSHSIKVMHKTSEIISIARLLSDAEIDAVFFKGAVLAEQVLGGPQFREFNDIDLLVSPDDREEVAALLMTLGYQPVIRDVHFQRAFFDFAGQKILINVETGIIVDLHWNFVGKNNFPISAEQVLEDRVLLSLGGAHVPVPCGDDLALILAGHGQKEGWASFGWALDFAQFGAKFPRFNWERAHARSRARGSRRPLMTAMLLVHELFNHSVNERLVAVARNEPSIVAHVKGIISGYHALAERRHEDDLMGSFRLCETRAQRAKVAWGLLTTRTIGDYEALPLPASLWWVYHLTRPVRLAWRRFLNLQTLPSKYWDSQRAMLKSD